MSIYINKSIEGKLVDEVVRDVFDNFTMYGGGRFPWSRSRGWGKIL